MSLSWINKYITRTTGRRTVMAYERAFGSEDGKLVLADLAQRASLMKTHGGDPFEEGKRSLLLYICRMLRVQPEELQGLAKVEAQDE